MSTWTRKHNERFTDAPKRTDWRAIYWALIGGIVVNAVVFGCGFLLLAGAFK